MQSCAEAVTWAAFPAVSCLRLAHRSSLTFCTVAVPGKGVWDSPACLARSWSCLSCLLFFLHLMLNVVKHSPRVHFVAIYTTEHSGLIWVRACSVAVLWGSPWLGRVSI